MKTKFLFSLLIVLCLTLSLRSVFSENDQVSSIKYTRPEIDFKQFPIADLAVSVPTEPTAKAIRARKSRKYNSHGVSEISETSDAAFVVNDELGSLSALPVDKSSVVLIGEITSAKAYLSEDKTAVYSEFEVRIQTVFKNRGNQLLTAGKSLDVERFGGRVRLPSGKLFIEAVDNQDMPSVGSKYLLFLTNDFIRANHSDEDFNILMGYELRAGKVFPLDRTSTKHPIARYNDQDESTLLSDLSSLIGSSGLHPN